MSSMIGALESTVIHTTLKIRCNILKFMVIKYHNRTSLLRILASGALLGRSQMKALHIPRVC